MPTFSCASSWRMFPSRAEKSRASIESDRPLGLTAVALAEIAWTLAGPRYRRNRGEVAMDLVDLLARENIVTVGFDKTEAQVALMACATESEAANFGDALISACARSAGLEEIYSFDEGFSRAGLAPIVPP